jgi:hypothetical protein
LEIFDNLYAPKFDPSDLDAPQLTHLTIHAYARFHRFTEERDGALPFHSRRSLTIVKGNINEPNHSSTSASRLCTRCQTTSKLIKFRCLSSNTDPPFIETSSRVLCPKIRILRLKKELELVRGSKSYHGQ